MWSLHEATNPDPSARPETEFEAAAEAWGIDEAFAGDAFPDDGGALAPSDGPCPTRGGEAAQGTEAWEARELAARMTVALFLPAAVTGLLPGCWAAGRPPAPATGPDRAARPGPAADDVASRYRRRDLPRGPND